MVIAVPANRFVLFGLLSFSALLANAQQLDEPLPSSSERIARARWQPIRQSVDEIVEELPAPSGEAIAVEEPPILEDGYYDQRYEEGAYYGHPNDGYSSCGRNCGCNRCRKPWLPLFCLGIPTDGWVSAEYLMWWQKGMHLPPLVTTSNAAPGLGVLGEDGTRILFGANNNNVDSQLNGMRIRLGFWLDACHRWAIEAEHFGLGEITDRFAATGTNGNPILARPFFNVLNGGFQDSELVSVNNVVSGTVAATITSELNGQSVHLRKLLCCGQGCGNRLLCCSPCSYCTRLEGLVGWRRMSLRETLRVTEDLTNPQGVNFDIVDDFRTNSEFNGFNFGLFYRRQRGRWGLEMFGKFAIGNTRQQVTINGNTTVSQNGINAPTQVGGLLAQRTNIGSYERNRMSVVPEFGVNLGWNCTNNLRFLLGYTFIYWSNVVRPGDQVDLDVNPNLLPPENAGANPFGALRPEFQFRERDYWVQGWNAGLEWRF